MIGFGGHRSERTCPSVTRQELGGTGIVEGAVLTLLPRWRRAGGGGKSKKDSERTGNRILCRFEASSVHPSIRSSVHPLLAQAPRWVKSLSVASDQACPSGSFSAPSEPLNPPPEVFAFSLCTCTTPVQTACPETPELQAFLCTNTLRIEVKSGCHPRVTVDGLAVFFPISVPEWP